MIRVVFCMLFIIPLYAQNRPSIEQIFNRFDRNNDGAITSDEMPRMFWMRFSRADIDGDGGVTRQELRKTRNRMQNRFDPSKKREAKKKTETRRVRDSNDFGWSAFDAGNIQRLKTKGYFGAAYDGRYIYYAPCRMWDFHGRALRYDTRKAFHKTPSWQSYDAGNTEGMETKGYAGAVYDGRYVYYVPMTTRRGRHARVLRYDTKKSFRAKKSWSAFDAQAIAGKKAMGYIGAVRNRHYIYFVPFGYKPYAHAKILRFDTRKPFKKGSSWKCYDAKQTNGLRTMGFYGGVTDGRYIYFVPFHDGNVFHGRVLCYDSSKPFLNDSSWEAYNAGNTGGKKTRGYKGAVYDGRYIYFVPFRNDTKLHCYVLRYDTKQSFQEPSSWSSFDAGSVGDDTRGYVGAAFDKRYIYFIPYSGDYHSYHARFLRYDITKKFTSYSAWTAYDAQKTDGLTTKGYKFSAFDGRYIYFVPYHNGNSFSGIALRYDTKFDK